MLIANGVRLSTSNPMRQLCAPLHGSMNLAGWAQRGAVLNTLSASTWAKSGRPDGVRHPAAWLLPVKPGAVAARHELELTTTVGDLNLAAGRSLDGTTTATFTLADAQLQLVVSASGAVTVTWTLDANLAGSLAADGTTSITFTLGAPTLGAIADLLAPTTITFSEAAVLRATGALAGDITPYTELSPTSLAEAVAALPIDGAYTLREVLRVCAGVLAGKTSVTDLGGGQAEVVFRDLSDALDRVTATLDGEERTAVTVDVSD